MGSYVPRKRRTHYTQELRRGTLAEIRDWIKDTPLEEVDRDALIRKIQLVIGASKKKAIEYAEVIMGE